MKQKIKEALRQEYKSRLELDDDRLDGVAAFAATFVTDESKTEEFVKNEATLAMLKSYQSILDKDRAKRKSEGEKGQQSSGNGNQSNPNPTPNPDPKPAEQPDIAAAVAAAVAAEMAKVVNPLQEKLQAFETKQAKEAAVAALDKFVGEWDYAKGFPKEAAEAKRIAMKLYAKGGESMTAEELIAEFRGEFDPAVSKKGVTDFTKPFESDGGGGASEAENNAAFAAEIRNALGMNKE